jgi:hypothetical protein
MMASHVRRGAGERSVAGDAMKDNHGLITAIVLRTVIVPGAAGLLIRGLLTARA